MAGQDKPIGKFSPCWGPPEKQGLLRTLLSLLFQKHYGVGIMENLYRTFL